LLERRGRDAKAWADALRALGAGATASHRTPAIRDDTLWAVVEDESASLEARAAAAVAVVSGGAEEARTRLRIAALGAAPRIRIAFEATADATTEADIERALDEVIEPEGLQPGPLRVESS
jgi:hypothetical protein